MNNNIRLVESKFGKAEDSQRKTRSSPGDIVYRKSVKKLEDIPTSENGLAMFLQ